MAKITCTTCGAQWETTDTSPDYWYESDGSISIGDYSTPALISAAGDDMTFCGKCNVRGLKPVTEAMGGGETQLDERGQKERETASKGKADVAHGPVTEG